MCAFLIFLISVTAVYSATDCGGSDQFNYLPDDMIYASVGNDVVVRCQLKGPKRTVIIRNITSGFTIHCNTETHCDWDVDKEQFMLYNFQPSYSGLYQFELVESLFKRCVVNFTLAVAEPPNLIKETNDSIVVNQNSSFSLKPNVSEGVPPAVVRWYKDGLKLQESSSFTIESASDADRGIYTAMIENQAGISTVNYTVYVNFGPLIDLSIIDDEDTLVCSAMAYPDMIASIILLEEDETGLLHLIDAEVAIEDHISRTLDYRAIATAVNVTRCSNASFICRVNNVTESYHQYYHQTTARVAVIDFSMNMNESSVTLKWTISPSHIVAASLNVEYRVADADDEWITIPISNLSSNLYNVENVLPNTTYEFKITGKTHSNCSIYSDLKTFDIPFIIPSLLPSQSMPSHMPSVVAPSHGISVVWIVTAVVASSVIIVSILIITTVAFVIFIILCRRSRNVQVVTCDISKINQVIQMTDNPMYDSVDHNHIYVNQQSTLYNDEPHIYDTIVM